MGLNLIEKIKLLADLHAVNTSAEAGEDVSTAVGELAPKVMQALDEMDVRTLDAGVLTQFLRFAALVRAKSKDPLDQLTNIAMHEAARRLEVTP